MTDTKPICKLRINGGNGNPINAHRECACRSPRDCPIPPGQDRRPAGPEQEAPTARIRR